VKLDCSAVLHTMTTIFEDAFEVKNINPEGKKFDRVSRLDCQCENYDIQLLLDINSDIYPMDINDKFFFALASSLTEDGDEEAWDQTKRATLADKYEYVMYGKVFKYEKPEPSKIAVYASFGGLLMMLRGNESNLKDIEADSRVYLLMRKTS